eukprot:m.77714 g.77714  ORF g.77714 m.77714 type:complete len:53 (+) comp8142_c0_seq5:2117-2275(+)
MRPTRLYGWCTFTATAANFVVCPLLQEQSLGRSGSEVFVLQDQDFDEGESFS